MAFTINKTDGTLLTTIADGTTDTTTDITLIGKNYAGYGEVLNENQVSLLENFANTTANSPTSPLTGQLFFDTTDAQLKVYSGTAFKTVAQSIVSTSQPSTGVAGDLWFDSTNNQIYAYTGTAWTLIGPQATAGAGTTGSITTTITDTTGTDRSVIQLTTNDSIVAIASSVEFTPASAISGYTTILKGITLGSQITANKFQGTATDADALGGVAAANYLKSNASDTTTGTLTIANDDSLTLGVDGDITMTQSGANFTIRNVTSDGNIIFNVNDAGSNTTVLTMTGSDASVTVANNLTVSGNLSVSGTTTTSTTTTILDPVIVLNQGTTNTNAYDAGIVFDRGVDTNVAFIWDESADEFALINTNEDGTTNGNITIASYQSIRATATSANYSDLAEKYLADVPMEYGDVVALETGANGEITKTTTANDINVFGVISKDPAFKMNAAAGDNETHPYVALSGRVPCKVIGAVQKGDRLVSSSTPGVAQKIEDLTSVSILTIIGRSLENNTDENVKYIEIVVGKN